MTVNTGIGSPRQEQALEAMAGAWPTRHDGVAVAKLCVEVEEIVEVEEECVVDEDVEVFDVEVFDVEVFDVEVFDVEVFDWQFVVLDVVDFCW